MQIAAPPPAAPPVSPPIADRVQAVVDDWRVASGVPGVAVAIRDGGAGVLDAASGVASLTTGTKLTPNDRMWAGSITKTAIAAVALRLADQGGLSLDARLSSWFPEVPRADEITVRMLLDQTAAVPDVSNGASQAANEQLAKRPLEPWSRDRLIEEIASLPRPDRWPAPGERHMYSNSNYNLLGAVIEQVTGTPVERVVDAQLFAPSGTSGRAVLDMGAGDDPTDVVDEYVDYGTGLGRQDHSATHKRGSFVRSLFGAAGGMAVGASDLARIGESILWDRSPLLDAATRADMLGSADASPDRYGLGIAAAQLGNEPAYWHNGAVLGARSMLLHLPKSDRTIAIMVNERTPVEPDWAALASDLLEVVGDR